MSKCNKCKIEILDDAIMCPLCHRVLEHEDVESVERMDENHGSYSVMYPDVELSMRKLRRIIRITIFAAVLLEGIALFVNYVTDFDIKWSFVSAVVLAYGCFTLIYSAEKKKSLQRKIVMQTLLGLVLIVLIDVSLGFRGWSLSFGLPSMILLVDIGLFVLMLVDSANWQNFIMALIWIFVISVICAIPIFLGFVEFPLVGIISVVVTAVFLAGTIVIGDKQAEGEIKRRFHI
jgi:hypothetical protein